MKGIKKCFALLILTATVLSLIESASAEFCAACCREVPEGSVYCTWCGANIEEAKKEAENAATSSGGAGENSEGAVKFDTQTASVKLLDYDGVTITYTGCCLSDGTSILFKFLVSNDGVEEIRYSDYYFRVGDYVIAPDPLSALLPHSRTEYQLFLNLDALSLLSPEKDEIEIGFKLADTDDNTLYCSDPVMIAVPGLTGTFHALHAPEVPAVTSAEMDLSFLGITIDDLMASVYFTVDNRNDFPVYMMKNWSDPCLVNGTMAFCSMTAIMSEGKYVYKLLLMDAPFNANGENTVVLPGINLDAFQKNGTLNKTQCIKAMEEAGKLQIVFNADGTVKSVS